MAKSVEVWLELERSNAHARAAVKRGQEMLDHWHEIKNHRGEQLSALQRLSCSSKDAYYEFQNKDENDQDELAPYVNISWNQKQGKYQLHVNHAKFKAKCDAVAHEHAAFAIGGWKKMNFIFNEEQTKQTIVTYFNGIKARLDSGDFGDDVPLPPGYIWNYSWATYARNIGRAGSNCCLPFKRVTPVCENGRWRENITQISKPTAHQVYFCKNVAPTPAVAMRETELPTVLEHCIRNGAHVMKDHAVFRILDHIEAHFDSAIVAKAISRQMLFEAIASASRDTAARFAQMRGMTEDENATSLWTLFQSQFLRGAGGQAKTDNHISNIKVYAGTEAKFKKLFVAESKNTPKPRRADHPAWGTDSLATWDVFFGAAVDDALCPCCQTVRLFRVAPDGKAHAGWHRCHIVPHAKGGSTRLENLMIGCSDCNRLHRDENALSVMFKFPALRTNIVPYLQHMAQNVIHWHRSLTDMVLAFYMPPEATAGSDVLALVREAEGSDGLFKELQALKHRVCELEKFRDDHLEKQKRNAAHDQRTKENERDHLRMESDEAERDAQRDALAKPGRKRTAPEEDERWGKRKRIFEHYE